MDFTAFSQFLEPFQEQFVRIYSVGSFIISLVIILWLFNFVFGLIQRIYSLGKAFGFIYRNYVHLYVRKLFVNIAFLLNSKNNENRETT